MTDLALPDTAKVFMSGRSQAVRLPKSLRFDVDEVTVRRVGDSLLLTPLRRDWAKRVTAAFDALADLPPMERSDEWPQAKREELWP